MTNPKEKECRISLLVHTHTTYTIRKVQLAGVVRSECVCVCVCVRFNPHTHNDISMQYL